MTSPAPWDVGNDDDSDLDFREPWMWGGTEAYIFLIDCTLPMFQKDMDDSTYIKMCIEGCKSTMLRKIKQNETVLTAVVLFGTKHKGQTGQPNHITTLQTLDLPNADRIKELNKILEGLDDFEREHGHSDNFSIAEALWHCDRLLSNSSKKLSKKTILLFTCSDNPHIGDPKLQHDARTRAADIANTVIGAQLIVVPLGVGFDMSKFYKELVEITLGCDEDDRDEPNFHAPAKTMEDILEVVSQCSNTKRAYVRVLWSLGGDVKLAVGVYTLLSKPKYPSKVRMERTHNSLVESRVQHFNTSTGEEIPTCDIVTAVSTSNRQVVFRPEEIKQVYTIAPPGLVLLGFKPIDRIKVSHHVSHPYFIYPEERLVKGSRTLFAALLDRCLARKVAAVCYFTPKRNAAPKLAALIPQEEKLAANNRTQLVPPGFLLVLLPYADNIRGLQDKVMKCPEPEPELTILAEQIVSALKFRYQPSLIDDPKCQKMWSGVEAIALGYDERKEVPDHTLPDYDHIDGKIQDLSEEFMNMAFPDGFDSAAIKKSVASKRTAEKAVKREPNPKIPKVDLQSTSMEDLAESRMVEKLKVDDLKKYLREQGVRTTGMKKDDMVGAVYNHLGMDGM